MKQWIFFKTLSSIRQSFLSIIFSLKLMIFSQLGQHQRAIKDYDEAIRLQPDLATAYNNRGIAYGNLGQQQRAIVDFNEAIRMAPSDPCS